MSQLSIAESAVIDAPPERVYAILADYNAAHPQILPKPYFGDLIVEQGGHGAGTVFRLTVLGFGGSQTYHMTVSEPEPGRQIVETDREKDLVTTFTVTPVGQNQARLEIATRWAGQRGLTGLLERLGTPLMRMVYRKELRQLNEFVQRPDASRAR